MGDAYQEQVRRFHLATGQPAPSTPTMPDAETRALRVRLLLEEVLEYANASGLAVHVDGAALGGGCDFEVRPYRDQPELAEMAHEATDVLYVALGAFVSMGVPARECFDEVGAANLRKAPGGVATVRADGKVLKPEGWVGPDVGAVLSRIATSPAVVKGVGSTDTLEAVLAAAHACEHDVVPLRGNPEWGGCQKCGETDFPLTEAAAYGEVACRACKDTGLVPMPHPSGLADGPCQVPDCTAGKEARGGTPDSPQNPLGLRDPSLAFGGDSR